MSDLYQITFTRKILPGFTKQQIHENLSSKLNLAPEKIDELLSKDKPTKIKSNVTRSVAKQLAEDLTASGLEVIISPRITPETETVKEPQSVSNATQSQKPHTQRNHPQAPTLDIPEQNYFKPWICSFILGLFMAVCGGVIVGIIIGVIGIFCGLDKDVSKILNGLAGLGIGLSSSFYAYRWSIKKYIISNCKNME